MKIQIELSGKFTRSLLNATEVIPRTLNYLIHEVQATGTRYHRRTPQLLRQSFGLDFIPEPVLINLCKNSRGVTKESDIYQVPPLKLLKPLKSQLDNLDVYQYGYNFICEQGNLNLTPRDPQLPVFSSDVCEQVGSYIITISEPNYPDLNLDFIQIIWNNSWQYWQNLSDVEKIDYALKSHELSNFFINWDCYLSNETHQKVKIWISLDELSLTLRSAVILLRLSKDNSERDNTQQDHISTLPEDVSCLVEQYRSRYERHIYPTINLPSELQPDTTHGSQFEFVIHNGRNHGKSRNTIYKIIQEASEFLLVSSYIIEDEELTELICQKSLELPKGVWILTDLNNELLDRIDEQILEHVSIPERYRISDERKKSCLKMLLNSNVSIRSGAFHLKTYISDRSAYLGSSNLTRGSLDFNKEAGIIFSNNFGHQNLINFFQTFWYTRSKYQVFPEPNGCGFRLRSVMYSPQKGYGAEFCLESNFLTPAQYQRDVVANWRNLPRDMEVRIYSRDFKPSQEMGVYLNSNTNIFINSSVSENNRRFYVERFNLENFHAVDNLHAKITILGNRVAYIGGINFSFNSYYNSNSNSSLYDLMYKTTDINEINQLISQLYLLR